MRATGTSPGGDQAERDSERREELERVASSLQATTAIAQALVGEADLDVVLDLIATRGRELVDGRWTAILIAEGDELELRATAGDMEMRPIGHRYSVDATLAGEVLRSGEATTVRNLSRHATEDDRELVKSLGAEHALFLPLEFRGEGVGVLMVASSLTHGEGFTPAQQQLLQAFAASAATAVASARSVAADRLRQSVAAAERERRRWARELHDETLQELGALMMLVDTARGRRPPDVQAEVLDRLAESLEATIAGLHRMITELRPATLDELGVAAAVIALAERRRGDGLDVSIAVDLDYEEGRQPSRLVPEVEGAIYRIVQEALTNVSKHAHASCARIAVEEADGVVTVEVGDDGRGLGNSDTSASGLGLAGMRERVTLLGGQLAIESRPGRGTTIRATIPALHVPAGAISS